ncbi:MAG: ABC transporter ATP-binding protein, partial [Asgard group archaeon]|nr:ABC transporter ATP-binding protein [Asgard group archaeon]
WMYGLVFLGFVLIAFISIFFIRNVVSPYWKKFRESASAMFGNIEESISGLEDIQPNGARRFIMSRFHIFSKAYFKDITKSAVYSRLYWFFVTLMDLIINLVILILSAYFADFLKIDVGTIYLLLSYARLLLSPIQVLIWQFNMMQNTLANIDRIKELFDIKSKIIDNGTKTFPEDNYNITFDNLYFSYKEEDYVLQDINFKLNTGKKIGLIGKTGSGKTTLTRLLFRLYDPNLGNIKINGSKLSDFSLENLRKNIAYVTQDVELFKASIKDNITFFDRDITDKEVLDVIKELNLSEWYESLPNGLDTILFSDELGLSAGEEQLLVLTRAFLKNPKIVILDEASSRLDPITERQIDQALEKLLSGRSAIIIAHRLQTLDKVDDIIILGNGEIIESGSRKELMKNKQSLFSKLLNTGLEGFFQ